MDECTESELEKVLNAQPTDMELILIALEALSKKVDELVDAKRQLEAMAESLQGKGPLALMSMFK